MIGPLARPLAQPIAKSLLASAGGGWSPDDLTGLVQRFLDASPTYYGSALNSYPILTPEETGTVAVPRGGRCYTFDGSNDYGTLGARLTSGSVTALTVCAWVKTSSASAIAVVGEYNGASTQRAWVIRVNSGKFQVVLSADGNISNIKNYSSTASINTGAWTHLAFTYSGGMLTMYVDGTAVTVTKTTDATVNSLFNSTSHFILGAEDQGAAAFFNGSISDVHVFNVAKSAGEIAAIYNQHLTPNTIDTTGLLAHYPCAEESGTIGYDASGNGKHLTLTNITQATFHAADTGVKWSLPNQKGYTLSGSVVIPASLADGTKDASGGALGVTGPVAYPATAEVPCVTGDGSAVYVDLGSALIPASADFTTTLKYYHVTNNLSRRIIACQDDAGHSTGAWYLYANISGGAPTAGAVWFSVQGASSVSVTSALTAGAWHDITISRAGSTFTLTVTAVGGSAVTANATMAPTILVTNTWLLKRNDATAYRNDGRISDLRITTGGVTTYFPLQEGPGSSNTNRDLYYCKSDGTSGTVSGAIVNGTVSTIWANRCPYVQDWSINYGGGIAANGSFVPGRIGSSNDAAGNAKTLSAGKFGNPYSRLCPNAFAAPALVNIGYTASSKLAPTDTVQATSPADTKFRRNASTGSDRYFATLAALTGSDKTNAETYAG